MKNTIEEWISTQKLDWRFPNDRGLSERTLDCQQLSIMEILRWKGERQVIEVFLDSFSCSYSGLLLRRSEPSLQLGWWIEKGSPPSLEMQKKFLEKKLIKEGYALVYYNTLNVSFSKYYQTYDIVHWSIITSVNDKGVFLIDDAGSPKYFTNQRGFIPWDTFLHEWNEAEGGVAFVRRESPIGDLSDTIEKLLKKSIQNMLVEGGLKNFESFITELEYCETQRLIEQLNRLEFDFHYYRKLRELWHLAAIQKVIPPIWMRPEWIEELMFLCKCWSTIMGVVMKWKRQSEKDYKPILVDYLKQTFKAEERFFYLLLNLTGGEING